MLPKKIPMTNSKCNELKDFYQMKIRRHNVLARQTIMKIEHTNVEFSLLPAEIHEWA